MIRSLSVSSSVYNSLNYQLRNDFCRESGWICHSDSQRTANTSNLNFHAQNELYVGRKKHIFRILVDNTWMNVLRVWHEVFVAEEMIRELFGRCGEMLTVRLNNKKFCHIRFIHEASVDAALFFSGNFSFYTSCFLSVFIWTWLYF